MRRSAALTLAMALMPFSWLRGQHVAPDSTPVVALMPVLDNQGRVIPEDLIRETMRPASTGRRVFNVAVSTLAGLVAFTIATSPPQDDDCSIYAPCTGREKFRYTYGPITGTAVGFLIGLAMPAGKVDRAEAVRRLRQRFGDASGHE
ncbi:MAG TPA: hypothetical protein VJ867_04860 [Gemmatimonadaceae bacterium]|nr:hypothetical protein [Gemmatimonadaceae bacterium]